MSLDELIQRRFMAKVSPEPNTGCWLWDGATVPTYKGGIPRAAFVAKGVSRLAHRVSFTMFRGPIPPGLFVCHKCDVPLCVNPDHLFLGSHQDNMADMVAKRRSGAARYPEKYHQSGLRLGRSNTWTRGEGNPKAKLQEHQIAEIRADRRATRFVAADFGVDRTTVQRIRRGALWRVQP